MMQMNVFVEYNELPEDVKRDLKDFSDGLK